MKGTVSEQTTKSLNRIRKGLETRGFTKAAVDRHEKDGLAVETGWVYGEVTAKIWMQNRGRNLGAPVQTVRGIGTSYVEDVLEAVDNWDMDEGSGAK